MVTITIVHFINTTRNVGFTTATATFTADNSTQRDLITLLRRESPDVFNHLPAQFLSEYKSFCWREEDDSKLLCLPSVYLAGMPKCGSTDLYQKLVWHPDLVQPTAGKENHYWARKRLGKPSNHLSKGTGAPTQFSAFLNKLGPEKMEGNTNLRLLDGTQSMLWDLRGWETRYSGQSQPPYSNANLLNELTPEAKILVITRDPVQRLYSDYLYFNIGNDPNVTAYGFEAAVTKEMNRFHKCLETQDPKTCCYDSQNDPKLRLNLGIYICFIRDWKKVFGGNILVISLEDYSSNPFATISRIFSFLGVSQPDSQQLEEFLQSSKKANSRRKSAVKEGDMLPQTRKALQDFYGPYNRELSRYLEDTRFLYNYQ